jgi:hypothetical protein
VPSRIGLIYRNNGGYTTLVDLIANEYV